jgi:hypothetical protein
VAILPLINHRPVVAEPVEAKGGAMDAQVMKNIWIVDNPDKNAICLFETILHSPGVYAGDNGSTTPSATGFSPFLPYEIFNKP